MPNVPIDAIKSAYAAQVVSIGDLRVVRGKSRRPRESCRHLNITYDQAERRIYCNDCEQDVEPFDAFVGLVSLWESNTKALRRREKEVIEAEQFAIRSRAAKAMDQAWRKRHMVPSCPHCSRGILPEDVASGLALSGREYEIALRRRD